MRRRTTVGIVVVLVLCTANASAELAQRSRASLFTVVLRPDGTLLAWLTSASIVLVPVAAAWVDVVPRLSRRGVPEFIRTGSAARWTARHLLAQLVLALVLAAAVAVAVGLVAALHGILRPSDPMAALQWVVIAGVQLALYLAIVPLLVVQLPEGLAPLVVLLAGVLLVSLIPVPAWSPLGHTAFAAPVGLGSWAALLPTAVALCAVAASTGRILGRPAVFEKVSTR